MLGRIKTALQKKREAQLEKFFTTVGAEIGYLRGLKGHYRTPHVDISPTGRQLDRLTDAFERKAARCGRCPKELERQYIHPPQ